jgi:hypothetical protein
MTAHPLDLDELVAAEHGLPLAVARLLLVYFELEPDCFPGAIEAVKGRPPQLAMEIIVGWMVTRNIKSA